MDQRNGDDLLERVVGELRELPPADESQVRRIVAAAQSVSQRGDDDDDDVVPIAPARHGWFGARRLPLAWAAGLVLAIACLLVVGLLAARPATLAGQRLRWRTGL